MKQKKTKRNKKPSDESWRNDAYYKTLKSSTAPSPTYESPELVEVDLPTYDELYPEGYKEQRKRDAEESLYQQAVKLVLETRNARNTFLRHKLKISQYKATAIIERMTKEGILGSYKGGNIPREVLRKVGGK